MKPAASRVNTITANAIVVVFSALMIAISGCAGLGNATATAPGDENVGMLETIGIAHGRPFEPVSGCWTILTEAAEVGRAMAKTLAWQPRIPN